VDILAGFLNISISITILACTLAFVFFFAWFVFRVSTGKYLLLLPYWELPTKLKKKKEFYQKICFAIENGVVQDFEHVKRLFQSISGIQESSKTFDKELDDYLLFILNNLHDNLSSTSTSTSKDESLKKIRISIDTLNGFVSENRRRNPNLDLPEYERNLFDSIEFHLKNNNQEMLEKDLKELAGAVKTLHTDLEKNTQKTTVSYWLTVIGFVIAVLPGLTQLWGWLVLLLKK
jgi:hypothetical protein